MNLPLDLISISNHGTVLAQHYYIDLEMNVLFNIQLLQLHHFMYASIPQHEPISIYYSNKSSSYFDCEAKVHKMIIIIDVCISESEKSNSRWMPYIELNWMLRNESNSNKSGNRKPRLHSLCVNISIIRPKIYGSKSAAINLV